LIQVLKSARKLDYVVSGGLAVMVTRSCDVRSMALRPRLSTGLPLSKIFDKVQTKQAWLTTRPAKQTTTFYSSAAWRSWLRLRAALDPWLCVPAFRRVCLYRLL